MTKIAQKFHVGGKANIILTALLNANSSWADLLERVHLKSGQVIIHDGVRPSLVYFPVDGLVSTLISPPDDWKTSQIQAAMGGDEDIIGLPALLSEVPSNYRAVVDLDGPAFQCSAQAARRLLDECPKSRAIVGRYADLALTEAWELMAAMTTTTLSVQDRLISFLVRSWYISNEKSLPFSQPFIAERMGARRPTLTELLRQMEADKLISRDRARINLLDIEAMREQMKRVWPNMLARREAFKIAMVNA